MSEIGEGNVYEQKLDTPLRGIKSNKTNFLYPLISDCSKTFLLKIVKSFQT